jgi:hypothetical protein
MRNTHDPLVRRLYAAAVLVRYLTLAACIAGFIVGSIVAKAATVVVGLEIVGTGIHRLCVIVRTARQVQRDQLELRMLTRNRACVELLRAARGLRVGVAAAAEYHGPELGARLGEIREFAAAVQLHAINLGLLAPHDLAAPADELAAAAARLAAATTENTVLTLGAVAGNPDFAELDEYVQHFKRSAVDQARGVDGRDAFHRRVERAASPGRVMRLSAKLMPLAAGQRWFAEAQSVLFELRPEQRGRAIRSYLLTAAQVIGLCRI